MQEIGACRSRARGASALCKSSRDGKDKRYILVKVYFIAIASPRYYVMFM
jgi:hypothetical protein